MPIHTAGYAALKPGAPLEPFHFVCRDVGASDVHIKVKYCGICHSDIHQVRNEWSEGIFPMVPGHEIVGIVDSVGPLVKKFKKGDKVGVGCLVDSCRTCDKCSIGEEQYCGGSVPTYNARGKDGNPTYGGYARDVVVEERFVCKIPDNLNLAEAAPLLCAGITTYSPMKFYKMTAPGTKIGVVGLGGLGHMAVKMGVAFGCHMTVISRSPGKEKDAKQLGALGFLLSSSQDTMQGAFESLDFIIDTVSAKKDMAAYINLLKVNGVLATVGLPPSGNDLQIPALSLVFRRKQIGGSLIGGLPETQEMLDFCGAKNITSVVEVISMDKINEAYERVLKSDVKYRFVLDVENSAPQPRL